MKLLILILSVSLSACASSQKEEPTPFERCKVLAAKAGITKHYSYAMEAPAYGYSCVIPLIDRYTPENFRTP